RIALHIELVWRLGLTHRQAAKLQPARSYHHGVFDVLWETPRNQVWRYCINTEPLQALMTRAVTLVPDPNESVCPPQLALTSWLRYVYDLPRTQCRIGAPGEPTLRALRDPSPPIPQILDRETYLLAQAGWITPPKAAAGR
ncbi:hypothetical protein, partial [Candidatus Competibacter denitrificans]